MAISGTFYSDSFSWNSRKDENVARRSTRVSCFGDDFGYPEKVLLPGPSVCGARDARADLARGRYVLRIMDSPLECGQKPTSAYGNMD